MKIDLTRSKHVFFFVLCLSVLSIALVKIEAFLLSPFVNVAWYPYLDSFGFIGSYTLLFTLFNNYIWKWPLFRWLRLVDFPILEGRWEGKLNSSYSSTDGKMDCALEIRQSFLGITVYQYTSTSSSLSVMATLIKKDDNTYELHYEYKNDPNENAGTTMHSHLGVAVLRSRLDNRILEGYYFNENRHDRGHTGKLSYSFRSKNVLGRFG